MLCRQKEAVGPNSSHALALCRKAYGKKPRASTKAAGATAQVTTVDKAAQKVADTITGRPALINGHSQPPTDKPRPDVQTNGYH